MSVKRVASVLLPLVLRVLEERHETLSRPSVGAEIVAGCVEERREQVCGMNRNVAPPPPSDVPLPVKDERHADAAFEESRLAPFERRVGGGRLPGAPQRPVHASVIIEKDDEGMLVETGLLKRLQESTDRGVQVFEHGCVGGVTVAVPSARRLTFEISDVLLGRLQRSVLGKVAEVKQKRLSVFMGALPDSLLANVMRGLPG